jgi:glycosyltransferase involved in cell wall biosynthesis
MSSVPRVAVIIATKGRPGAATHVLRLLERQSLSPVIVLLSATEAADLGPVSSPLKVECIFGPAGSSVQRNRALDRVRDDCDIAVFLDDDFAPGPGWMERCAQVFASQSSIAGMSGILIRDGAQSSAMTWEEAESLIAATAPDLSDSIDDSTDLYGCNMAFRMSAIKNVRFDERLVLYGWLEDKDFSRTAARSGRLVHCSSMIGVHLGLRSKRTAGKRYGYSQVVNAWYLYKKGTMPFKEASTHIAKALLANGSKSLRPEAGIDRRGRLHGNLIGLGHLFAGRGRPEKIAEL